MKAVVADLNSIDVHLQKLWHQRILTSIHRQSHWQMRAIIANVLATNEAEEMRKWVSFYHQRQYSTSFSLLTAQGDLEFIRFCWNYLNDEEKGWLIVSVYATEDGRLEIINN